ncbi:MAG: hypothetical protein ACE5E7_01400 [Anaerolineae bacterium]
MGVYRVKIGQQTNTPRRRANEYTPRGMSRAMVLGLILLVALVAFEVFNFDTTRYALRDLLGDVSFLGLRWATILAIAFCAIDFAGLARLFTPQSGPEEPRAVWYLTGAWLLGATMNAIMTWWAVSLTLLAHEFGNEVLGREQLLQTAPVFVAALVWLTRILFIGALSVAGDHLFAQAGDSIPRRRPSARPQMKPDEVPPVREGGRTAVQPPLTTISPRPSGPNRSDAPQRPVREPAPSFPRRSRVVPASMQARRRNQ